MTNVVVRGRAQTGRWVDGDVWQQFSFWKTLFAHRNASCAGGATTVPVWRATPPAWTYSSAHPAMP